MSRSLLTIDDLGAAGIARILDLADHMAEVNRRPNPKVPALRGKTVCNIFFEDSTRTRLSFETAAKRLSADTMTFAASQSSINKGESLRDTIETIAAMGVDAFVVRHKSSGAPQLIAGWTNASVINAGDGWHAHPTQGLLDAFTVRTALARTGGFDGLRVAMVGDVKHSRVARSTVAGVPPARCPRHRRGATHVAAARHGRPVRRRGHRSSRRRDRRHRRPVPLADAAGADERGARAEPSRVHGPLRPDAGARREARPADAGDAPRPDESGRRDRGRSGGASRRGHHPTGHQRHRCAHGGPLRPARAPAARSPPRMQRRKEPPNEPAHHRRPDHRRHRRTNGRRQDHRRSRSPMSAMPSHRVPTTG